MVGKYGLEVVMQDNDRDQMNRAMGVRFGGWAKWTCLIAVTAALLLPAQATAQSGQLPDLAYYQGFGVFYEADYKDAEKYFNRGGRRAYKIGNRRFLDSICYWTMVGECYYHMGNYAEAIAMYEQSIKLYMSYQGENWQSRVTLPPVIQRNDTAFAAAQVTWGVPTRRTSFARVPDTYQVMFGQFGNERVLQQGGVVQRAEIKRVNLNEVMRCLALCLHRRRVIKGPVAKLDPLSGQIVASLSSADIGGGNILRAYNGVLLGIAQATMEDYSQAANTLKRSLQMSGGMDHPLTAVGLLESANIAIASERFDVAKTLCLEASYSAAVYGQFDLVEESLATATSLHLRTSPTPFTPLTNVIEWGRRNRARLLQASAIVRLAESFSEAGDAAGSAKVLSQSGRAIRARSTLDKAVVSARLKYVNALNLFQTGNFGDGMNALAVALQHFQTGSVWLYRLNLTNQLVANNRINARQADQLYSLMLRDPTANEWRMDPAESIAFLTSPHVGAMEAWFNIVVARRDYKRALEISELVRRHRFFASLPLGGRLMGFRWTMQAPESSLSKSAMEERTQFLNQNLTYKQAAEKSRQLQVALAKLPIRPEPKTDEARQQLDLLKSLTVVSKTQEAMLASNALRRVPSELVFPPSQKANELRSGIREDQVALVTLATSTGYHFFLVNSKSVQYVSQSSVRDVHRSIGKWLKQLKVTESVIDVESLSEEDWKESARTLTTQLFPNATAESWEAVNELLIVPDGALWYLPFEALLVGEGADEKFLSELAYVRYSPTLALAFGAQRDKNERNRTAVVVGRINSKDEGQLAAAQFDELVKVVPEAAKFDEVRVPTNGFGTSVDQLVIWSEVKKTRGQPFLFAPMQLGSGKLDGTLGDWMQLPWRGPEHVIVPYYQADGLALRGTGIGGEMFFTTMGLMASGTRSILISRWSTGGKTSLDLTRQYLEKRKDDGIPKAIADSRQTVRESDIDAENEPRLRASDDAPQSKAVHPYFWASHMLLAVPDERELKIAPVDDPLVTDGGDDDDKMPANDGDDKDGDDKDGDDKDGDDKDGEGKVDDAVDAKPDMKEPSGNLPGEGGEATKGKTGGEVEKAKPNQETQKAQRADDKKDEKADEKKEKPSGVGWQPRPAKPRPKSGGGQN